MNVKLLMISGCFLIFMMAVLSGLDLKKAGRDRQAFLRMDASIEEQWKSKIMRAADRLRIAPVNAKVDRVWKAIPGYNGIEVDIDRTLKLALEKPNASEIPFVYREIAPDIQLADLPPNPIYKGNPDKPIVSFMVNVAWGNEYLPEILRVLREENVKATFFLDGKWLKKNKETALTILNEGHELSNHGYSHYNMSTLSEAAADAEIRKTEELLKELGVENRLFAPPSGDFDQDTVRIAKRFGLYTILWTLDTVDWKKPDPDSVVQKINSRLEPGALILMHPTEASSKALGPMIRYAKNKGYAVGTVSDLISEKRLTSVETPVDF